MIEILGTISSIAAILGVVLNNYKLRACFIVWMFTNAASGLIHLYAGIYSLAIRDLVFFVLAIHGFWKWGKK